MTVDFSDRFDRGAHRDRATSDASARWLLAHLAAVAGRGDLDGVDVLDVGCGVKFTQALLNHELPIGTYTGIDVYEPMVDVLRTEVDDPRFSYHHLAVRNEKYNPDAPPMGPDSDLGVGDRTFDLICLFSVFTHLDPTDSASMLRILRRHVRPDGWLVFTVAINELTEGGHGLMDFFARKLDEQVGTDGDDVLACGLRPDLTRDVPPYLDLRPDEPLTWPVYSREYAWSLVEEGGWSVVDLLPPTEYCQHQFVCRPA